MNLIAQDHAAAALVDALDDGRLSPEARIALLRVVGGHERRTPALLTLARAEVARCQRGVARRGVWAKVFKVVCGYIALKKGG